MPPAIRRSDQSLTASRLLDAAQELFASQGYAGTSVREVVQRAGAGNTGAVNYHFGGKQQLFIAVLHRVVAPVEESRMEALAAARTAGALSVDGVLDAWVRPLVHLTGASAGRLVARLFARLAEETSEDVRPLVQEVFAETDRAFISALHEVLPHLPAQTLRWRYGTLLGILVFFQLGIPDELAGRAEPPDEEESVRHLCRVMAGVVTAPDTAAIASTASPRASGELSTEG